MTKVHSIHKHTHKRTHGVFECYKAITYQKHNWYLSYKHANETTDVHSKTAIEKLPLEHLILQAKNVYKTFKLLSYQYQQYVLR